MVREGGVVSMTEPFKNDSGKRRSALTSAFEELALHTNNLNDEVRPNSTARRPPPDRDHPSPRLERRENPSFGRLLEIPSTVRNTLPSDPHRPRLTSRVVPSTPPTPKQDGFSAHVTYGGNGAVFVTENEQTLDLPESLGRPTPLRRRALDPNDDDAEARSYGRQHGSSQGLNMLSASARAEEALSGDADSTIRGTSTTTNDPETPKVGTPESVAWSAYLARGGGDVSPTRVKEGGFRFSVDGSRPTESALGQSSRGQSTQSTESVKMAYSWNPGTVLGGGGSEKPSVFATSRRVPIADRGESPNGTTGELAHALAKVVVVHPPHEEEDECCEMSAGRTQRGSFSSLLLLEAQELFDTMETLGDSPVDEVIETADRVAIAGAN